MTQSQQLINAQKELLARRQQADINYRPTALVNGAWAFTSTPPAATAPDAADPDPIYHHGQIALGANRAGQSCHYQLWLALRHIDADGRGWLSQETAQAAFCADRATSTTYLYKKPRLRQILAEGNGAYWRLDTDNQRIFYHKEARLMDHLGLRPLTGRHVAISAAEIFTNIQTFRAHSFAAWLANRENPISQYTIEQLTGLPARTQLRYIKRANIKTTSNLSIGPRYTQGAAQECAWHHDGTFKFVDFRGKQGPDGRHYVAWHLPISYSVTAATSSRRRQKRTNKAADLRLKRTTGNGRFAVCFFRSGGMAAKMANRQTPGDDRRDHYWPGTEARSGTKLWHCLTV